MAICLSRCEVFETGIIYGLKELGILRYRYRQVRDPYMVRRHRGVEAIKITRFGRIVMSYLARRSDREFSKASFLDRIEDAIYYI